MNRRQFFCNAAAAGVGAAFPKALLAATAESSVRAVSLDGKEIEIERMAIRELGEQIAGPVMLPDHADYDAARRIWNGMHDKRPALIARCMTAEDVSHAVAFARERSLLTAVRGGGHSWPGKSVCDGGLMIDLSNMTDVTIDTRQRHAVAEGGALLGHLDTASLKHGLVTTTGVVSHTGVGGYTLGGGFGRINRRYGLTIDNLLGATIVTADGKVRRVSAQQEPDLFWAIRGGGGNFGVVTAFEYQLHSYDRNVLSGNIFWPLAQARDVLEFYADWSAGVSDDLYAGPMMFRHPELGDIVGMEVVYAGKPAAGEKELAPLREVAKPVLDGITVQDHMVMQTGEDSAFAHGIRSYAKNGMVKEWSQKLVDALIEAYDPRVIVTNHVAGGAVKRVGELETAFPHRNAEIMLIIIAAWNDPAQDEELITAARAYFATLEPMMGGYYDNIEYDREKATGNYGPAYPRLSKIKGQYDPTNLFRLNSNIEPG